MASRTARAGSPIVLISGEDSLLSDRALARVLKERAGEEDPAEFRRLWGDECSINDVFSAAQNRSLFSSRTIVIVRRAEKLRGMGKSGDAGPDASDGDASADERGDETPVEAPLQATKPARKKSAKSEGPQLPELDDDSLVVFVARKVDRRGGLWKKISDAATFIDVQPLKGRALQDAAAEEARALGVKLGFEALKDLCEQAGPSLGRIVSELEKMSLYAGRGMDSSDVVSGTGAPPPWTFSDAVASRRTKVAIAALQESIEMGEPPLMLLSMAHRSIRRTLVFGALRSAGMDATSAASRAGVMPFKVRETEEAVRQWTSSASRAESKGAVANVTSKGGRAMKALSEADRLLKLSSPGGPALASAVLGAGAE